MNKQNYYNSLWTDPNTHGTIFWNGVDFNTEPYIYQESVFHNYLKVSGLRPRSVLELGCGTGRMTKIVLEELGASIEKYDAVDIALKVESFLDNVGGCPMVDLYELDILSKDFDETFNLWKYDLLIASEVLMHILPSDIDIVISKVSNVLSAEGAIINIDWSIPSPELDNTEWCFIHDYDSLYRKYGLTKIARVDLAPIKQGLFHYGM